MYANGGAPARARWEVLWVKDGRVVRKPVGHDLAEGLRIYTLATTAGRRAVTLRCTNMQFPPPDKYADREDVVVERNGKRYRGKRLIEPRQYLVRMGELNVRGVWWCGYCMQMRRFVKRSGFYVDGVWNADEHLACPICGASHRIVGRYNPMSLRIEMRGQNQRVPDPDAAEKKREKRRQRRLAKQQEEDE